MNERMHACSKCFCSANWVYWVPPLRTVLLVGSLGRRSHCNYAAQGRSNNRPCCRTSASAAGGHSDPNLGHMATKARIWVTLASMPVSRLTLALLCPHVTFLLLLTAHTAVGTGIIGMRLQNHHETPAQLPTVLYYCQTQQSCMCASSRTQQQYSHQALQHHVPSSRARPNAQRRRFPPRRSRPPRCASHAARFHCWPLLPIPPAAAAAAAAAAATTALLPCRCR